MKQISIVCLALLLLSATTVFADLAPDPGFTRLNLSIVVETNEDLSGYRFFLVSSNLIKEVNVKKGSKTTVGALGGGARYSSGYVVAIPAKELETYGEHPVDERLRAFESAVSGGQLAGTVKLIEHRFSRDVRTAEAPGWKDPLYRLEKEVDKGIKAVWVSGGANESKTGPAHDPIEAGGGFWTAVASGTFLSLALIGFGLWAFLRSRKKVVDRQGSAPELNHQA